MDDDSMREPTTAWLDGYWNESVGLLDYPCRPGGPGSPTNPFQQPGVPVVRESVSYAVALLARDGSGDRARAQRAIANAIAHQIDDPGSVCHGTFRRSPVEPLPGPAPREWIDYDPNWREFIGCALSVVLERFPDRIDAETTSSVEDALRLACEGTRARAVAAEYSNIALMSAFLLDWVGARLGVPDWRAAGQQLAEAVAHDYRRCGAFAEHNSPTYYGVDLHALALWREHAAADALRLLGRELEAELWRDLVRFYHPGLRNLCGPFTRAYGMDMTRYVASLGVWIAPCVERDRRPVPELADGTPHGHDQVEHFWVALLGSRPPEDVRRALRVFEGERRVEQTIGVDPPRRATAWLADDVMLGGEHTGGRVIHWQQHPATVHWRTPDGEVGWIRVVSNAPVDAVAHPGRLDVTVRTGLAWLRGAEIHVWLEVSPAPDPEVCARDGATLELPGLRLGVALSPGEPSDHRKPGATDTSRCLGWVYGPGQAPRELTIGLSVID